MRQGALGSRSASRGDHRRWRSSWRITERREVCLRELHTLLATQRGACASRHAVASRRWASADGSLHGGWLHLRCRRPLCPHIASTGTAGRLLARHRGNRRRGRSRCCSTRPRICCRRRGLSGRSKMCKLVEGLAALHFLLGEAGVLLAELVKVEAITIGAGLPAQELVAVLRRTKRGSAAFTHGEGEWPAAQSRYMVHT